MKYNNFIKNRKKNPIKFGVIMREKYQQQNLIPD